MDSLRERLPFVHDFGRDIKNDIRRNIKIVRVVSFLEEKEAGAKAVSREKLALGLAPTDKLPAPFRVVLFQKNLEKKRACVFCDFSSFEKGRKGQRLENFLHLEKETIWVSGALDVATFNAVSAFKNFKSYALVTILTFNI